MIAYNNTWLNNLQIKQQIEGAAAADLITKEERVAATNLYPIGFYTPNIFIRAGLFILSVVIALFSIGLMALVLLGGGGEKAFGILLLFFAALAYGALEAMVQQKHHYKSGVDDALIWIGGGAVVSGVNLLGNISATTNAVIVLIVALYFLLRFGNAVMGILVPLAFLYIILLAIGNAGNLAKSIAPFLLMLLAGIMYFIAQRLLRRTGCRLYKDPLKFIKITTLLCGYAAVNYFTVREASVSMFHLELADGRGIPIGWLFWFLTFFIPFGYIFRGVQKKDVVLLRVGLLLVAAIVFTVRSYYAVAPLEIEITLGGLIMVATAYALIQYLRQPKNGLTSEAIADNQMDGKLNIEALVIAETFTAFQPADNNTNFGAGDFGGGGASREF